jgi:hypothetical protein
MSNLTKQEFDEVLVDVRKAYRLLYQYQRRTMDLVKFIGDYFSYSYSGGWPWFSNGSPRKGSGSLDNWAWDWLSMYLHDFHFGTRKVDGNEIKFSILLQSDTGFFDVEMNNRLALEAFGDVESSESRIFLMVGKNCWMPVELLNESVISRKEKVFQSDDGKGGQMFAKAYNLSEFINEESTLLMLSDFEKECAGVGISEFASPKLVALDL